MTLFFMAADSQTQLVIAGLLSGSGIIALIVKFIIQSPDRETSAYKQGGIDEHDRYKIDIEDCKKTCEKLEKEIKKLRNGLLHLVISSNLSDTQRKDIAVVLGFKTAEQLLKEAEMRNNILGGD